VVSDFRSRGIVLKSYLPRKQKYLILDYDQGPIEVVATTQNELQRLCNGAIVTYHVSEQRSILVVQSVDILDIPFSWARHDILFLHHLLELAAFFVRPASPAPEVFDLLQTVYMSPLRSSIFFKKLVVARFFLLLGSWPETDLLKKPEMIQALGAVGKGGDFRYTAGNLDEVQSQESLTESELAMELDAWLLACVREHPQQAMLNTVHFLSDTYE
jgi:hypothetical protein